MVIKYCTTSTTGPNQHYTTHRSITRHDTGAHEQEYTARSSTATSHEDLHSVLRGTWRVNGNIPTGNDIELYSMIMLIHGEKLKSSKQENSYIVVTTSSDLPGFPQLPQHLPQHLLQLFFSWRSSFFQSNSTANPDYSLSPTTNH